MEIQNSKEKSKSLQEKKLFLFATQPPSLFLDLCPCQPSFEPSKQSFIYSDLITIF